MAQGRSLEITVGFFVIAGLMLLAIGSLFLWAASRFFAEREP